MTHYSSPIISQESLNHKNAIHTQQWDFSDVDWALMLMCAEITIDNNSIHSEAPNSQKHLFDTLFHAVNMQMWG